MPEVVCNTSPLQYLHQTGLLDILRILAGRVSIPPAVVSELEEGHARGVDLPDVKSLDWIEIRRPASAPVLPLVTDLGPGETEVLALALEMGDAVVILDDDLARRTARRLGLKLTGTLGLLLEAKRAGLVPAVKPIIDKLHVLRFRLAPDTRAAVLRLAGEAE